MRLGVLSNERLSPWVNWTTLGPPLLRTLAAGPNAQFIAPPPLSSATLGEWSDILRTCRSVDTLFWMQGSARPEFPVHLASLLAGRVRRAAFVIDPWRPALTKIGMLSVAQGLDPCFVPYREAYEELSTRFPRGRFEWLPHGIDTEAFSPLCQERRIFAFWMGRRYQPLHDALVRYCADRGLEYRFREPGVFPTPADLGRIAASSRYFLVTPPDLDNREKTGGFSPLVMRYMEGLATGTRLLGVLPKSGEYEALLPLDAILQVAPDGSDLVQKLDADKENPNAQAAVERAMRLVRSHHSWSKRAEQIYGRLNSGAPTGFNLRTSDEMRPGPQ
jgi:hypothetical protein